MSNLIHAKVSAKPDSLDSSLVQPSDWNNPHLFSPALTGIVCDPTGANNFIGVTASAQGQFLRRKYNTALAEYEFASPAYYFSTDYNFSYANPANLTAAVPASVTFPIIPQGLNAYSPNLHILYINDTVGTSEVVMVTSVVGNTITFTPAHNHISGNYTITSATAGIQEALNAVPARSTVMIPPGTYTLYAAIYGGRQVYLQGAGAFKTTLESHATNATVFNWTHREGSNFVYIGGFQVRPTSGTFTVGSIIDIVNYTIGTVSDVAFISPYVGINFNNGTAGGNPVFFDRVKCYGTGNCGIRINSTGSGQCAPVITDFYYDGIAGVGVEVTGTVAGLVMDTFFIQSCAYGMIFTGTGARPVNEVQICNGIFDGSQTAMIQFVGAGGIGDTNTFSISNCLIAYDTGYGIILENTQRISLKGNQFRGNGNQAFITINTTVECDIANNTFIIESGATTRVIHCYNTCNLIRVFGNKFTNYTASVIGVELAAGSALSNILIDSNDFGSLTTPVTNGSTTGPVILRNNTSLTAPPTVASAATITVPVIDKGDVFVITGTTNISRILGYYPGAKFKFITTGILSFATGGASPGDIGTAFGPTVANTLYEMVYNSSSQKWFIK